MASVTIRNIPAWTFSVSVEGSTYEVVWMILHRVEDGYEEPHMIVSKDGVKLHLSDVESVPAVRAARAYRMAEIREQYKNDGFSESYEDNSKRTILAVAQRSWTNEWVGQESGNRLYVQNIAELLELGFPDAYSYVDELVVEGKLGINGNIIIPWEEYNAAIEANEARTGHKKIFFTDFGGWWCEACGRNGDPEDGVSLTDLPCEPEV